jgi:hypothetical protein
LPDPRPLFLLQPSNVNLLACACRAKSSCSCSASLFSHHVLFKSVQSLESFFHSALLTAPITFRTRSLCKVRAQDRVLCIKQLVHESFPDCASFRFDDPKFLEIVVDCLHMYGSACASHEDYQFNFPSCTLSLCLSCYFSRLLTRTSC